MLKKINVHELLAPHPPRTNFNLFWVDDRYSVRVARISGEYPWHRHKEWDEGWFVISGRVRFRSEAGDIELGAGEAVMIPHGLKHSPLALEDLSTVLIVNAKDFQTNYLNGIDHATAGFSEFDLADGTLTERQHDETSER